MKFNNVTITQETILKTRQWFADNAQGCIDEVLSGEVKLPSHVNFEEYKAWRLGQVREALAGDYDHTFTFMQKAHYIQTGEYIALLP